MVVLLVLLSAACLVIFLFSRRHRVNHENVTDDHEVMIFAGATGRTLPRTDDGAATPKRTTSGV